MLSMVKKGMWVKVRGSVQNDTFMRDLVMMANDIHEIRPKVRMDTAPEGEKRVEFILQPNESDGFCRYHFKLCSPG